MRSVRKGLAGLLCVLLLLGMLPAGALAAEPQADGAETVAYNLGSQAIVVGSDEEQLNSGEIDALFEPDGDYTIQLEPGAFFPYEVQFTCGGEVSTKWFLTPEDSVEVGGHTFQVYSEEGEPALSGLSFQVGGDVLTVYPEEKNFTDEQPELGLQSMMPLKVQRFDLDLRGYFPEDLTAVSVDTVLSGLSGYGTRPEEENIAAWAKWGYYDADGDYVSASDDYTVLKAGDTIDLSSFSSYDRNFELELIVGTADQLNMDNIRYIVEVRVNSLYEDFFTASVVDEQRQSIPVYDCYYTSIWTDSHEYLDNVYCISFDQYSWKGGEKVYLSLGLNDPIWAEHYDIRVVEGYYESYDPAQEYTDLTDQIWNVADLTSGGGYIGEFTYNQGNMDEVTVVFLRDGAPVRTMPLRLWLTGAGLSLSMSGSLYADTSGGGRNRITRSTNYDWNDTYYCQDITIELDSGYPANGSYYYGLSMYNPAEDSISNNGVEYVKKAVVGYYETETDIPEEITDIKEQLFSNPSVKGFQADYSNGVIFTIINIRDEVEHILIQTKEWEDTETEPELPEEPRPLSRDTYFWVTGAYGQNSYVMPYDADSYYYNGYQTVLLLNPDETAVTAEQILPTFNTGYKVEMFASQDGSSAVKQVSGETPVTFVSGEPVQYSAAAENGASLKNYWVTFLTQQEEPTLFVNAVNDEAHYDEETGLPVREVFLTEEYGNHHDVFFANLGRQEMTGLYVRLEDAQNVALDEYWTIGETTTLGAFTSVWETSSYGELANVAKVRLVPQVDSEGVELAGVISGTLVIGFTGDGEESVQEVKIKLTGVAGTPQITTDSVVNGVKYVPYSSVIQTNNMYDADGVSFALTAGSLPAGITLKPNGELYGVPTVTGEYTFTLTATYTVTGASDSREFTLTILDNTDENVLATNMDDQGYLLLDAVGDVDVGVSTEDTLFRSEGAYGDFMAFYLDGRKLVDGKDYDSEEGSTKITIRTQTFKNAGNGTHTISAEFRTGGTEDGTLKRTSQNVQVSGVSSGSGGSSTPVSYAVSAPKPANGTVSCSPSNASAGTKVTITVKPDSGYALSLLNVGDGVELTKLSETEYTFIMPKQKVTVQAEFKAIEPDPATGLPFLDVSQNDWYYEAVKYAFENGLMQGTGDKTFAPDVMVTRGMMVTVLYRLAKAEPVENVNAFTDVAENSYCYDAANWAVAEGLISGYGDGTFGPDDPLTRQQMVTFLHHYAEYIGCDMSATGDVASFLDIDEVCDYAYDALMWAYGTGLVIGTSSDTLMPNSQATRGQIATILLRFSNYLEHSTEQE